MITAKGRMKFQTRIGEYQKSRADRLRGQADLIYRKGVFYLVAIVDAPEQSEYDPVGTLGVDLGIINIATDSDGDVFSGKRVEIVRKKYNQRRRTLQRIGTKNSTNVEKNVR